MEHGGKAIENCLVPGQIENENLNILVMYPTFIGWELDSLVDADEFATDVTNTLFEHTGIAILEEMHIQTGEWIGSLMRRGVLIRDNVMEVPESMREFLRSLDIADF